MAMIDFDTFLKFAEEHFDEVDVSGSEVKVNSIFENDTKLHMWCNPSKNAYHCWKSDKSGNLFDLVSRVAKCSYQEAVHLLSNDNELRALEDRLDRFFSDKYEEKPPPPPAQLTLPSDTFAIQKIAKSSHLRTLAEKYLTDRCLPVDGLLLCLGGKCRNRIIIPYYGPEGDLIYWNARDITGKAKSKYRGPDAGEVKVGKGDVLFMQSWPATGTKIYLTEGEFDAMSLSVAGFHGAACGGKALVDKQIELLRPYNVCVCFDTDKSGADALNKIGDKLISNGIQQVTYVRPPINIKDWNQMLIDLGEKMVNLYVTTQEKPFMPWTSNILRLNNR